MPATHSTGESPGFVGGHFEMRVEALIHRSLQRPLQLGNAERFDPLHLESRLRIDRRDLLFTERAEAVKRLARVRVGDDDPALLGEHRVTDRAEAHFQDALSHSRSPLSLSAANPTICHCAGSGWRRTRRARR
ncbi:MAG: hypothetical protein QM760_21860 [Nibricoccus sp.]